MNPIRSEGERPRQAADASEPRLSVLVVGADKAQRESIVRDIAALGHRASSVDTGSKALQRLDDQSFDVVVSDWQMDARDGVSGAELCRRIRARDEGDRYTHFLFLTTETDRAQLLAGFDAGADEVLTRPIDLDELALRLGAVERVVRRHRRLRRDSEGSFALARVDPLTGVGNRRRLEEDLRVLVSQAARYGQRCTIAMCDVDHFKRFNDAHGHLAGDDLLRKIAQTMQEDLRVADRVYRYGGEEFVVTFVGQSAPEASAALDRVRTTIAERCGITLSAGVAELRANDDADKWLQVADSALYRAKQRGRNRVEAA